MNLPRLLLALSLSAPFAPTLAAQAKVDFQKQIWPILDKNCTECHRATYTDENGRRRRPKGRVEFDTRAGIEKSKNGKLFVAKQPQDSLVYEAITLPADDEDLMPPQKKGGPLDKAQIELIKRWIEEGADFGAWTGEKAGADGGADGPADDAGADDAADAGGRTSRTRRKGPSPLVALKKGLRPVPPETLARLAETPFRVQTVGDDNPLLVVSCAGRTEEVDDKALQALEPIREHVTELDLGRTRVGDAGCAAIAAMPRLTRLDLRQTRVGDQGVKELAALRELRTLNLFDTEIGDYALAALEGAKQLETLYVWQTDCSAKAVVKLREAVPGLRIVFTADLPEPSDDPPAPRRRR